MASRRRVQRLNQLLREELSRLIRRELKDPRVELVTVTEVDVSGDLRHAKVYVRTLRDMQEDAAEAAERGRPDDGGGEGEGADDEDDEAPEPVEEALDGLRSAEGFLRGTLGRELRIRRVPELHFRADRSLERARRIETLLDRVSAGDEEDDGGV